MKKFFILVLVLGSAGFLHGSIRIDSPNGGETWALGSRQTIRWTPSGVTATVNVFLFRGSRAVGRLNADPLPGTTTSLLWEKAGLMMGETWASVGTDYKICVQTSDGRDSDSSDANFSLTGFAPTAVVQAMSRRAFRIINTGDATIDAGSPFTLTWTSSGYEGVQAAVVAAAVLDDPSAPPPPTVVLGNATVESGRFAWNVPRTYYGRWRLKVVAAAAGVLLGEMAGRINIMPPTRFRIVSPIGGETYRPGDQVLIRWETINPVPELISSVSINILRFSGGCGIGDDIAIAWNRTLVNITAREYRLTIPSDAPGSSYYLVDIQPFSTAFSSRYVEVHHSQSACFSVVR